MSAWLDTAASAPQAGWRTWTRDSLSNGGLMRTAPLILPALRVLGPAQRRARLGADVAWGIAITHNNPATIGASLGLAWLLAEEATAPAGARREAGWWARAILGPWGRPRR